MCVLYSIKSWIIALLIFLELCYFNITYCQKSSTTMVDKKFIKYIFAEFNKLIQNSEY